MFSSQPCIVCSFFFVPAAAFIRHEFRNSAVKRTLTSQKKKRTLLWFHAWAPTCSPRTLEKSSFRWIKVKFLYFIVLQSRYYFIINISHLSSSHDVLFTEKCQFYLDISSRFLFTLSMFSDPKNTTVRCVCSSPRMQTSLRRNKRIVTTYETHKLTDIMFRNLPEILHESPESVQLFCQR